MLRYTGSTGGDDCLAERQGSSDLSYEECDSGQDMSHRGFRWQATARHPPKALETSNPLVRKLATFVTLSTAEVDALEALARCPKPHRTGQIIIHEGAAVDHVCLIVQGFACRYKLLACGRRQIMGFLIPGDLCDVHFVMCDTPDHSVVVVGKSSIVKIPTQRIMELIKRFPNIERALSLAGLVDSATLREWLLNVGQRDAMQKLSHLFCEMSIRLEAVGQMHGDGSFGLPVNQMTLADTIGLTSVHINRTLQRMRAAGLIRFCRRRLTILQPASLAAIAGFNGEYLRMRSSEI